MPEEIQDLLEKIRREGVEKARAESEKILASARQEAVGIVKDAERQAQELLKAAEREADLFEVRGRKALEQAARDIILAVGNAVERIFGAIIAEKTAEALSADALKSLIEAVVRAYAAKGMRGGALEVLLSPDDVKKLGAHFIGQLKSRLSDGVTVRPESGVRGGFVVSVKGGRVHHDFSVEAIAETLSEGLRPQLAEIVMNAAKDLTAAAGAK